MEELHQKIIYLYLRSVPTRKIVQECGLPKQAVVKILKSHNVPVGGSIEDKVKLSGEIRCRKCLIVKPLEEIVSTRVTICRKCMSTSRKEKRADTRVKATQSANAIRSRIRLEINRLKTGPCVDCGGVFPAYCMDFDHRDTTEKLMSVSAMVARHYSMPKILAEVDKCELVCANCHRLRTSRQALKSGAAKPLLGIDTKNEKQRTRRRELRLWVQSVKSNRPCHDCDKLFAECQMDYDHRDPTTKKQHVSRMVANQCSKEDILSEIAKCDLVCVNCHRIRTMKDSEACTKRSLRKQSRMQHD